MHGLGRVKKSGIIGPPRELVLIMLFGAFLFLLAVKLDRPYEDFKTISIVS